MTKLPDHDQRELALDPLQSFIIQAPAGSGKTELLTRRFLKLLSIVKQPESILAITFTKKAAYEMQTRILNALRNPASELAQAALENNQKQQWQLLQNPNRLRIQTMDALCYALVQKTPLLSSFNPQAAIADHPRKYYQQAARNILLQLDQNVPWQPSIYQLLQHLDNNAEQAENLFVNLLEKRDQWLPLILDPHPREALELGLKAINLDCLEKVETEFKSVATKNILDLLSFAAENLKIMNPVFHVLWKDNKIFPTAELSHKKYWQSLANFLLTQEDAVRQAVNKNLGFPAEKEGRTTEEKALFKNKKREMQELLHQLSSNPVALQALANLRHAPSTTYSEAAWKTLQALFALLKVLTAELELIFSAHQITDYISITQSALSALGKLDNPSDLALRLDYKIEHILVDEFQDTSIAHFHLLELLTAGWEEGGHKTLFLVGDPMQSVYRFRQAEVGLFLRAKQEGINQLPLQFLTLSCNFRSTAPLIQWFNNTFEKIFPKIEDVASGAVAYAQAISAQGDFLNSLAPFPILHCLTKDQTPSESELILQLLKSVPPKESCAILVRSRHHLVEILPTLRANNIAYEATEIEALSHRMVIQDLLSLTKALLNLNDRVAWLSLLRAPWLNLSLTDIYGLVAPDLSLSIWESLQNASLFLATPALENFKNIMQKAMNQRGRCSLRELLEDTWITLAGPAYLSDLNDLSNASRYFELLETLESGGDIENFAELETRVNGLYASSIASSENFISIMTIHKAKGLEFDWVILPGLERLPKSSSTPLLRWMQLPRKHSHLCDFILAPIQAKTEDDNSLQRYLAREEQLKNQYESMRLLYVAATRAKKNLHLICTLEKAESEKLKSPSANSFGSLLICKSSDPI